MASFSRWGCLFTLTITYINVTLSPGENALLDSQLLAIGNLLAQTCRVLQFAALIYGVHKFKIIFTDKKSIKILKDAHKNFLKGNNHSFIGHSLILLVNILAYSLITWPAPILLMKWFPEFAKWHKDKNEQHASIGYTALAWHHHVSDLVIRICMTIATQLIIVAWASGMKSIASTPEEVEAQTTCIEFSVILNNYKETGKVAAALQHLFQEWFVMSWVVYFIGVTGNTTLVIKALFKGLFYTSSYRSWFYFAHLVNDFFAFLIPYICGGLMNYYHNKYRECLEDTQERVLSKSADLSVYIHQKAVLIPQYKFIPALCCLNIPLESAGYSFTLILTSFAFVLSFITAFTDV